jgi:hypothetical protein
MLGSKRVLARVVTRARGYWSRGVLEARGYVCRALPSAVKRARGGTPRRLGQPTAGLCHPSPRQRRGPALGRGPLACIFCMSPSPYDKSQGPSPKGGPPPQRHSVLPGLWGSRMPFSPTPQSPGRTHALPPTPLLPCMHAVASLLRQRRRGTRRTFCCMDPTHALHVLKQASRAPNGVESHLG